MSPDGERVTIRRRNARVTTRIRGAADPRLPIRGRFLTHSCDSTFVKRFGLGVVALVVVKHGKVVQMTLAASLSGDWDPRVRPD